MRILLDMDEVITDFTQGALILHGFSVEDLEKVRTPGSWDINTPLGLTPGQFWRPINEAGEQFWTDLEPLPWAHEVVDIVESLFPEEWYIASSPSWQIDSRTGKIKWLQNFFGKQFDRFVLTPHKHLMAHSGSVLIDDRDYNVEKFREAGGHSIVFPTRGNSLHLKSQDPMTHLITELETLLEKQGAE